MNESKYERNGLTIFLHNLTKSYSKQSSYILSIIFVSVVVYECFVTIVRGQILKWESWTVIFFNKQLNRTNQIKNIGKSIGLVNKICFLKNCNLSRIKTKRNLWNYFKIWWNFLIWITTRNYLIILAHFNSGTQGYQTKAAINTPIHNGRKGGFYWNHNFFVYYHLNIDSDVNGCIEK